MSKAAIIIDNLVQFFSIKNGIDELISKNVKLDIYVPEDPTMNGLDVYTYNKLVELGYYPLKESKGDHYRVLLEPYPKHGFIESINRITYDYIIKYKYGLISTKPRPEHSPEWTAVYDAMLVHSSYEYNLLKIYTDTIFIKQMKYDDKLAKENYSGKKKRLLYMPTFKDVNPDKYKEIEESFKVLKKDYEIIIKAHHATQFRESEIKHNEFLHSIADKIYDSSTPIGDVLIDADSVLTGNSGSAFEAMYLGIPVSIYLDDLTKYDKGITSLQHKLIKDDIIPWTDRPLEIPQLVKKSFDYIDKQKIKSRELFNPENIKINDFCSVVVSYMSLNPEDDDKRKLRAELRDYMISLKKKNSNLEEKLHNFRHDNNYLKKELKSLKRDSSLIIRSYEESKSWRITRPLRLISKLLRGR